MRFLWVLIFVCFLSSLAFAQTNQTESLTITTYYPEPYGVFRYLKVTPTAEPTGTAQELTGVMYYDSRPGIDMIRYHNNIDWVNLTDGSGTGGPGSDWAMITLSCPWGSDANLRLGGLGCSDQCNVTSYNCCKPSDCPVGWTEVAREATLAALDAPKANAGVSAPYENGYEWMDGYGETFNRPAAAGNVLRKCVKKGATVITLSHPWGSDHNVGANQGWGNQCTAATNYAACGGPPPNCPVGWHTIGTNVEVSSVACPRPWDEFPGEGCYWGTPWSAGHPVADGALTNICEKNITG